MVTSKFEHAGSRAHGAVPVGSAVYDALQQEAERAARAQLAERGEELLANGFEIDVAGAVKSFMAQFQRLGDEYVVGVTPGGLRYKARLPRKR